MRVRSSLFLLSRTKLTGSLETEALPSLTPPFSHRKEEVEDKVTLGCLPSSARSLVLDQLQVEAVDLSDPAEELRSCADAPLVHLSDPNFRTYVGSSQRRVTVRSNRRGAILSRTWTRLQMQPIGIQEKRVRKSKNGAYGGGSG